MAVNGYNGAPTPKPTPGGVGPVATGTLVTADFGSPTGNTLHPTIFGVSAAIDGPDCYGTSSWNNSRVQAAASGPAGFKLTGMYIRVNPQGGDWGLSPGSPNMTQIQKLITALPKIIDPSTAVIAYNAGPDVRNRVVPDPIVFGQQCVQVAKAFAAAGIPVKIWEIGNEWGVYPYYLSKADYYQVFNGAADALLSYNPDLIISGPNYDAGLTDTDWVGFANACPNVGLLNWHWYGADPRYTDNALFAKTLRDYAKTGNLRAAVAGTPAAKTPQCMGEWNIMGNTPSDPRQQRIQGAVFAMLAIHTAFTNDPLTRYGSIWDWLGDDYYGLIIDPNNATSMSTRMPAYSVVPAGYALKLGRQFMGGDVVRSSRQSGNIRFLATSNDTRASLLIINFDTSTTFSGSIGLSRWPANSTGRGTANLWQLSPSHPTPHDTGLTVTNGVIPSIRIPAMSITVITIGG